MNEIFAYENSYYSLYQLITHITEKSREKQTITYFTVRLTPLFQLPFDICFFEVPTTGNSTRVKIVNRVAHRPYLTRPTFSREKRS